MPVILGRFALRRGTAATWTATNHVLDAGEEGYETDTGRRKVGDGVTAWTALPYDGAALFVPFASTPPNPAVTPAYVDTSTVPPTLQGWNGTAWVAIGGGGAPTTSAYPSTTRYPSTTSYPKAA